MSRPRGKPGPLMYGRPARGFVRSRRGVEVAGVVGSGADLAVVAVLHDVVEVVPLVIATVVVSFAGDPEVDQRPRQLSA